MSRIFILKLSVIARPFLLLIISFMSGERHLHLKYSELTGIVEFLVKNFSHSITSIIIIDLAFTCVTFNPDKDIVYVFQRHEVKLDFILCIGSDTPSGHHGVPDPPPLPLSTVLRPSTVRIIPSWSCHRHDHCMYHNIQLTFFFQCHKVLSLPLSLSSIEGWDQSATCSGKRGNHKYSLTISGLCALVTEVLPPSSTCLSWGPWVHSFFLKKVHLTLNDTQPWCSKSQVIKSFSRSVSLNHSLIFCFCFLGLYSPNKLGVSVDFL